MRMFYTEYHPQKRYDMAISESFAMTELGALPEEWDVVNLGEVGKVVTGKTPSTKEKRFWNGTIPFITPAELQGSAICNTERTITEDGLKVSKALPRGTVLVSCIGYIGKVGIVDRHIAVTNQQINAIIPDKHAANNWYLAYMFIYLEPRLKEAASITTVPILNKSNFELTKIPLPPLPEQHRIAAILSAVQDAKEKTGAVIAAAKSLKKSLMRHLFTYGPVPAGAAESVPLTETEIGLVPEGWEVVRLGELYDKKLIKIQNGFPSGNWNEKGIGIPHIRPFNVSEEGKIVFGNLKYIQIDKNIEKYILQNGDVIFNNTNSEGLVGKTAYWDNGDEFVLSNHMTIIRVLNYGVVDPIFLAAYLHKKWFDGLYLGLCRRHVNQASISLARLKSIPIPLPPLPTQQKIASILSTVDQKIEAEENKKKALDELFKSLLHNLMTGKIRVNHLEAIS